jgi:cobalt/nickel transport system permease protein
MGEQSFLSGGHRHRGNLLDSLADGVLHAIEHALDADRIASQDGLLQKIDPRIKLVGMVGLIVVAVAARSLATLFCLFLAGTALALASRVGAPRLARQIWLPVLAFTGAIALPAVFLVPGNVAFHLPILPWPATEQGLRSAAFLVGRSETSATFALVLILSTPWPHLLKAMRFFRAPIVLVVILGMTYRYIFLLLETAHQMFVARRSRLVGPLSPGERRRVAASAAGALLVRTLDLSADVHLAMISRGYRGEAHLLDDFRLKPMDWLALGGFALVAAAALWLRA